MTSYKEAACTYVKHVVVTIVSRMSEKGFNRKRRVPRKRKMYGNMEVHHKSKPNGIDERECILI
ncbi:CLUMA_CG002159, isoform A [Clunio marinus]|uniref:CLUMA_CG002159, isoform A n=1 Tax=Clunio marinus TaxID=568069 RepID=A0A1J1HPI0_9DIPT|nr:CLUMA_CG002159, isoform A [Clunio marinus]